MKMTKFQMICGFLILALIIYVAVRPTVVYAPTPRVILLFAVSTLPALLFGSQVKAQFDIKLGWLVFTTSGIFAACLGVLTVLIHFSKPEEKITVFQVFDEHKQPVNLEAKDAVGVPVTPSGLSVTKFVDGNTIIMVFPEQAGQAELRVKPMSTGPAYVAEVSYAGSRTAKLFFGQQLKQEGQ
jgi:hypothetical protein